LSQRTPGISNISACRSSRLSTNELDGIEQRSSANHNLRPLDRASTNVLTRHCAISHAAMTVFPNAVPTRWQRADPRQRQFKPRYCRRAGRFGGDLFAGLRAIFLRCAIANARSAHTASSSGSS
jgi:hypothetical protein